MNKTIFMGRLTKDPEITYTKSSQSVMVASYSLAVDRRMRQDGTLQTDFIPCVAYGKLAEFAEKHLHKGQKITVCGRLQVDIWDGDDEIRHYKYRVVVEEHYFADSVKER
jgi:single-strand DNA-binding protein